MYFFLVSTWILVLSTRRIFLLLFVTRRCNKPFFAFSCCSLVLVSMNPRYFQCWWVLLLFLFLALIVSPYHLSDVTPCAKSSVFLSFGLFIWVPLLSSLRMVLSILQGELLRCLSLWWDFCCRVCFRVFSFLRGSFFLLFLFIFAF